MTESNTLNSTRICKIKEFCDVGDGAHASIKRQDTGIMYLSSKNFKASGLDLSNVDFITASDYEKHFSPSTKAIKQLQPDDVLFGIIGSLGVPYVFKRDDHFGISSSVAILRPKKNLNSYYLYYFMTSNFFQQAIDATKSGVAQGFLSLEMIRNLPFINLAENTQQKIAAILSAYDDLIENNQKRIALLEKAAEEIYREWFVRMRFPGWTQTKFEKGIPVGWAVDKVNSLGKIVTGKTPSKKVPKYYDGPYLFVKTPDMHGNMFVHETGETLTEEGFLSQPSQTIPEDSISVSCIGTGGVVSITTSKCQTNQQINSVILRDQKDLEWAFYTLRSLKEAIQMFGATGATMTNLSKGKFSALKIILPEKKHRKAYHRLVNPIFNQVQALMKSNYKLKQSRDLLLSRLISGKLAVDELEIHFPPSMKSN